MPRPDFSTLTAPDDARAAMLARITPLAESDTLATAEALGRTLAADITSPQAMPDFRRSTMDGYAVRAADEGPREIIAEVPMGALADVTLEAGQAALVHTGGNVPEGADAVIMVERTRREGDTLHTEGEIHTGDNIIEIGEDLHPGDHILSAGHRLRIPDLGGLMALGITQVDVVRRPRVAIFSTGDEVIPPDQPTQPGQVRDINSTTIAALTRQAGGIPEGLAILPDDTSTIWAALKGALDGGADVLVVTAGSSMSERDVTADIFRELGEVHIHGIATKPGKPTILGMAGNAPLIGLPGNPMSAFVQFTLMVMPLLGRLQGQPHTPPLEVPATLSGEVPSSAGREDFTPARVEITAEGLVAHPIPFKSNLIFKLVQANALIHVPMVAAHLPANTPVTVRLL